MEILYPETEYTVTISFSVNKKMVGRELDEAIADLIYDLGGECKDISEYRTLSENYFGE